MHLSGAPVLKTAEPILIAFHIQYSLQLADTIGAKKNLSANWMCPPFGKYFNIGLNFENKAFFYIHKV